MKQYTNRTAIFIIAILISFNCPAQKKFSTHIAFGIGGNFEKAFPGVAKKDKGRLMASVAVYYKVSDKYSAGIEAITSGRFGSLIGDGGLANVSTTSPNTIKLNYNNMGAGNYLIRNKFSFRTDKELQPYFDLGFGITTFYYNINLKDLNKVRKSSFVVSPEVGVTVKKWQFSWKAILGGKTPAYSGFDANQNATLILGSINSQQLYLTAAYRLFRF